MTFYIKQNDTSPIMQATLQDADGNAVDLTGSSVRFHMRPLGGTTITVDAAASISEETADNVRQALSESVEGAKDILKTKEQTAGTKASSQTAQTPGPQ